MLELLVTHCIQKDGRYQQNVHREYICRMCNPMPQGFDCPYVGREITVTMDEDGLKYKVHTYVCKYEKKVQS